MKVELSKVQYEKMLKAFYLSDLVLHSTKEDEKDRDTEFMATEQYILSLAKDFGFEHYVEYDEEFQEYFPTPLMEQDFDLAMRNYEQDILPDQIAATLARNELEDSIQKGSISQDKVLELLFELEEKYYTKLEGGGLHKLKLD
ncbi:hypothetical protein [Jeotgalibacillus soli]|uniref:Uncharacterized protein n=1 Tax=Jeotgalibacillus soli TaxID=889306 RepID=A0A0C2RUJ6_9BACL|nr:hypothetical protein [Jeotgalibacillus soli]KIL45414.1 hypothetical protein KP78_29580 [Jeotgalibacillus soli]